MNRPRTAALACVALAALAALGFATPPHQRPTTRVADCTTSGCHADIVKFQFLHAPAAVDACEICHVYVDPAQHTFKLVERHDDEPICSFCHIGKSTFGRGDNWVGLHVHEPVANGDCVACHNPHGSNMRNLIRGDTVSQMCASCHDNVLGQRHMHPPVGEKECLSCHRPHSGQFEKLLHQTGRELCLSCHADVMPKQAPGAIGQVSGHLPGMNLYAGAQFVMWTAALTPPTRTVATNNQQRTTDNEQLFIHEPLLGECSECHNPHGSPYERMLQKDVKGLCTSCHADIAAKIEGASVHHSAVLDDRACLNCHSPHHSKHVSLLNDQPMALCASCHQKPQQRADGSRIEGMSVMFKGTHFHGPITSGGGGGDCASCHDIHGGTRRSLLTANFSDDLYQSLSESSYELCFTCHDSALATQKDATIPSSKAHPGGGFVTNFRDGDVNLHYVHVNAPRDSGRSCRFCHDTHTSNSPRLMRDAVPYGQWHLPITYRATETGGTCGAGCHREREYRRE